MSEALAQERLTITRELAEVQRALSGNPTGEEMRTRRFGLMQPVSPKAG